MKPASWTIQVAIVTILACIVIVGAVTGAPVPASAATLSADEAAMLTYMREEEKLARDVYLTMYDLWGAVTFSNIATSEQQHTDTMKKMLDKYRLPDPALPGIGLFTDLYLQQKYNELVALGSQSYVNGLYAGATIEEIDMIDIQHAIDVTTRSDLIMAYQNLIEGSKNHLRAFVGDLAVQGITYTPQFISQEFYDSIIGQ